MKRLVLWLSMLLWVSPAVADPAGAALARVGDALAAALESPPGPHGYAIRVSLRGDALPPPGVARQAPLRAQQQRVLDAMPASAFALKHRFVQVPGFAGAASRGAIEALRRHPEVASIHLDRPVRAVMNQGRPLVGVDAVQTLGLSGAGIRVAVLDTGVDSDHEDLSGAVVAEQCFCDVHPSPQFGGCCPSGAGSQSGSGSAEDDEGHGTGVSGIITSAGVSGHLGVAPDAEIVAVKVLSSSGGGTFSDIDAGLDWVLQNHASLGVRVVNVSISDGGEYDSATASACDGDPSDVAITALTGDDVAVFVASGNDGHDAGISAPACVADAISVGGVYDAAVGSVAWCGNAQCTTTLCTDDSAADVFVCHSNSGSLLDILAPNYATTTSQLGGGSTEFGGTSASSPYAAGSAALLLQARPTLTPAQIRTFFRDNGPMVTNSDNGLSFRRTDVELALAAATADCGDGVLDAGEACDDGNTADGDCCSSLCLHEASGAACDTACTTGATCDGAGSCGGGSAVTCDDVNACTDDSCDPGSGCVFTPNTDPCDDGDACTSGELCAGGACGGGSAVGCDDANACTDDGCDPGSGCVFTPNTDPCDDGDACTTGDACSAGACVGGSAVTCDDVNPCTDDGCDSGSGCVFTPNTLPCSDGDTCTDGDVCSGGVCVAGAALDCDDGDACTADACDMVSGCTHTAIPSCASVPTHSPTLWWLLPTLLAGAGVATLRIGSGRSRSRARGPGTSA